MPKNKTQRIEIKHLPASLRRKGIEEKLLKICEDNDVVFLAIFGSFVRGEQKKKSDIDIAIEFDKNERKSLLDLVRIEYELKKIFKRKIDLGIFSSISPYIIEDVKREMKIIYEKR
ncbi:MAG: nucleotidyltransferase domain-containing protein [Candidatus Thermoplasmatota archaeon]